MSVALAIENGDIVLAGTAPKLVQEPIPEIYLACSVSAGSFPGDLDLGSEVPLLPTSPPGLTPDEQVAAVRAALVRVEEARLLTLVDVYWNDQAARVEVTAAELESPMAIEETP